MMNITETMYDRLWTIRDDGEMMSSMASMMAVVDDDEEVENSTSLEHHLRRIDSRDEGSRVENCETRVIYSMSTE
jgi:hypothetical protein